MYLYEAPMIFYGMWKVVSPFVSGGTREGDTWVR